MIILLHSDAANSPRPDGLPILFSRWLVQTPIYSIPVFLAPLILAGSFLRLSSLQVAAALQKNFFDEGAFQKFGLIDSPGVDYSRAHFIKRKTPENLTPRSTFVGSNPASTRRGIDHHRFDLPGHIPLDICVK
jgi:hypothetical protein